MNIELTAAEVGMFVAFTIAIVGIGMGIRLRAMRKRQNKVQQDVETHDTKQDVEPQQSKEKPTETESEKKPEHDVDAMLEDLKKDSDKE
ncbi:hypothetical protein CL622_07620 [archaeon]|nr:hypothetical protein [archaeon]|tara:strand:- start:3724 stop:3990 length:267 start_codon:yes stop_codon:yes gene_type:complete